jgi:NAD(P)-dependent dehydrogenase (short-subunit alcohol dehydrogenase family)
MVSSSTPTPGELFTLRDHVAVVTGASSGLGARFARLLAAAGAEVYAVARRAEKLTEVAAGLPSVVPVVADIGTPEGRRDVLAELADRGASPNILINNAGTSGPLSAFDEDAEEFSRVLGVNLTSAYALTRDVVMSAEDPSGMRVINVSSILGMVSGAPVGGAGYAASKAGLIGLTRELAGQLGRRGVRVNALAPGWFPSEMTFELLADESSAKWVARNSMLGRAGHEGELDTALLFLASPHSSYVTGQVIAVDGGWTAR